MVEISSKQSLEVGHFSNALLVLAELAPDRATLGQLTFFFFAAMADLRGQPATFGEIKEATGDRIGKSLHTTYKLFLDGARRSDRDDGKGLNWLYAESDPSDLRRKFLRLTPKGHSVVEKIAKTLSR